MAKADALYLSTIDDADRVEAVERFEKWRGALAVDLMVDVPIFTRGDLLSLVDTIRQLGWASTLSVT